MTFAGLPRPRSVALVDASAQSAGRGEVESWTAENGRAGPERGIVPRLLPACGERFMAEAPSGPASLASLEREAAVGLAGTVSPGTPASPFTPDT